MMHLLASLVAGDAGTIIRRTRRNAILYVLAGILALSAFAAGLVALGLYLAPMFGAVAAALLVAIGTLALALVLVAMVLILNRRDRRHTRSTRAMMTTAAISFAPYLLRQKSPLMLAAVAGLGFLAAGMLRDDGSPDGD